MGITSLVDWKAQLRIGDRVKCTTPSLTNEVKIVNKKGADYMALGDTLDSDPTLHVYYKDMKSRMIGRNSSLILTNHNDSIFKFRILRPSKRNLKGRFINQ